MAKGKVFSVTKEGFSKKFCFSFVTIGNNIFVITKKGKVTLCLGIMFFFLDYVFRDNMTKTNHKLKN